jgi:hypothetical protein
MQAHDILPVQFSSIISMDSSNTHSYIYHFVCTYSTFLKMIKVMITLDRLLTTRFKTWNKSIYVGKRVVISGFILAFIIMAINLHIPFTTGYSEIVNGTLFVYCNAQYKLDYTLYNSFGKV